MRILFSMWEAVDDSACDAQLDEFWAGYEVFEGRMGGHFQAHKEAFASWFDVHADKRSEKIFLESEGEVARHESHEAAEDVLVGLNVLWWADDTDEAAVGVDLTLAAVLKVLEDEVDVVGQFCQPYGRKEHKRQDNFIKVAHLMSTPLLLLD